jgi:hypothetical protein
MASIKDAREGLAYIMKEWGATWWSNRQPEGYIISVPIPRGKSQAHFVPLANVEEAEACIENDTLPYRWVVEDIAPLK